LFLKPYFEDPALSLSVIINGEHLFKKSKKDINHYSWEKIIKKK